MKFAEDQQKTKRIVEGNYSYFDQLYYSSLHGAVAKSVELTSVHNDHLHFNSHNKPSLLSFLPQVYQIFHSLQIYFSCSLSRVKYVDLEMGLILWKVNSVVFYQLEWHGRADGKRSLVCLVLV